MKPCSHCSIDLEQAPDEIYSGIYDYLQKHLTRNEMELSEHMIAMKRTICSGTNCIHAGGTA